jgi:hypothetical protein
MSKGEIGSIDSRRPCSLYMVVTSKILSTVYFIKIGVAYNPKQRISMVQTGCPIDIEEMIYWECPNRFYSHIVEKSIHEEFSKHFTRCREWFHIPVNTPIPNLTNYITVNINTELGGRPHARFLGGLSRERAEAEAEYIIYGRLRERVLEVDRKKKTD